jgi:hypothetical protein
MVRATHISTNHNPFIFRVISYDYCTLKMKALRSLENIGNYLTADNV